MEPNARCYQCKSPMRVTNFKGKPENLRCYKCRNKEQAMQPTIQGIPQMVAILPQNVAGMPVQMVPIQQNHKKNNKRRNEAKKAKKQAEKEQKAQQNDFSVLANNLEDMREQMEELKKMKSELEDLKNIVEEEEKGERKEIEQKDNYQNLVDSFTEFNVRNEMIDPEKRKTMTVLISDFLEKTKVYDQTGKMDTDRKSVV